MANPGHTTGGVRLTRPCLRVAHRGFDMDIHRLATRFQVKPRLPKVGRTSPWTRRRRKRAIECPRGQDPPRPSRHLATAPSHRSCDLLLKAIRGVTIAVVSSRERKRRQPGLATDDPAFVGWHQLVRGIQGSYVHFDFVCAACENGRARSGDRKTARRSRVFRHRSLPKPEGTPRKREKGPHDACGSRDSDKGLPDMGVPTRQFGRRRTGNRR